MSRCASPGLAASAALTLAAACGSSSTPTSPGTATGTSTPTVATVAGCEVGASSDGLPMSGIPKSPYYDYLGVATSSDGRVASGFVEALPHASAPDATRMPDGSIGVYYNSGETGGIWLARLTGTTLTKVSAITVNGVLRPERMGDVNVDLINGKVRMFYLNGLGPSGGRTFCVAESSDGLSFTIIAAAMRFPGTEADPTVVKLADGSWLMAFSRENHSGVGFARSTDGLTFTQFGTASIGAIPELAIAADGRPRLYVCSSGVQSYISSDSGVTWTKEGTVIQSSAVGRKIVCDTSYLASEGRFIFKTTDAT